LFVVIEGIDGSGKGTVTKEMERLLKEEGLVVTSVSFPRYTETLGGRLVGRYLNGDFGTGTHPYLHSHLYSLDRLESKPFLEQLIKVNDVVLCDRYVPSNLCYAALQVEEGERDEVVQHFVDLEYGIMKLPVPDVMFFLDMPVKFAVQNIAAKAAREYTDNTADIHEADEKLLSRVRSFYASTLMDFHPKTTRFEAIECERNEQMVPIAEIVEQVHLMLTRLRKGETNDA
jgi:dTMP kinase